MDFISVVTAIKTAEQSDKREQLTKAIRTLSRLEGLARPQNGATLPDQQQMRAEIQQRDTAFASTRGHSFLRLYEALKQILVSDAWPDKSICPACLSHHDSSLSPIIESSLAEYATVERSQKDIQTLWTTSSWTTRLRQLEEDEALAVPEAQRRYATFTLTFRTGSPTEQDLDACIALLSSLDHQRAATIVATSRTRDALERELPPSLVELTTKVEYAKQIQESLSKYTSSTNSLQAAEQKRLKREAWSAFIQYAEAAFSTAEAALSTAMTTSLETEYRSLYESITSNPEIVPVLRKATGTEDLHLQLGNVLWSEKPFCSEPSTR